MRWLVVSPYLPHPRIGHGGGNAVLQLCQSLGRTHETSLLCLRREREGGLEASLVEAGVDVRCVGFRSEQADAGARIGLILDRLRRHADARLRQRPYMVAKYDRPEIHEALRAAIESIRPDVVQVEYGFMAPYARTARSLNGPVVLLNTHESGTLVRLRRVAGAASVLERRRHGRDLTLWARHEAEFGSAADVVTCVTEGDRAVLWAMSGADNLVTVPLGADVSSLPTVDPGAAPSPPTILFVGSFSHPPNVAGVRSLLADVMPRVWKQRTDAVVEIVGKDPPAEVQALAGTDSRVRVRGFVDDLHDSYARAQVFVAPLWSGGGIKIKVLEAMGRGAAVVSTPIGAEGIDEDGTALRLAGSTEEFAEAILGLVADPEERARLGRRARAHMESKFAWDAIVAQLTALAQSSLTRQPGTGRTGP